jgi:hypothetical protein
MGTHIKLNRVSRVLRQNIHYQKKFLYTSTILSMLAFPAFAMGATDKDQVGKAVEVIKANYLYSVVKSEMAPKAKF